MLQGFKGMHLYMLSKLYHLAKHECVCRKSIRDLVQVVILDSVHSEEQMHPHKLRLQVPSLIKLLKFVYIKGDSCYIRNWESGLWKVLLLLGAMNTWMHMNTIDIDAYCTCSQVELTSPLDRYFLFSLVVLVLGRHPCEIFLMNNPCGSCHKRSL